MIVALKIIVGLIFIILLGYACFKPVHKLGRKRILLIIGGIIPYLMVIHFLLKFSIPLFYDDSEVIKEVKQDYFMIFVIPYLLFIVRIFFNKMFSGNIEFISRKSEKNKRILQEKARGLFLFHSIGFFFAGFIIGYFIIADKIPNSPWGLPVERRIPRVIEKWLFVSDDSIALNKASSSLFNLDESEDKDTLTFLLYDDDSTGWMINKRDSIRLNYDYSINELKLSSKGKF